MFGRVAVECLDCRFCHHCHFVYCPVIEIGLLLRVTDRPMRVAGASPVASVSRRAGVATVDRFAEAKVAQRPAEPAVADTQKLSVPASRGQPHFDFNMRVRRRTVGGLDSTECGEAIERGEKFYRAALSQRQVKSARTDDTGVGD